MALKISKINNKRVSFGYSYIVPDEKRENKNISIEIKIESVYHSRYDETTFTMPNLTILDLSELVFTIHDELEKPKIKNFSIY